MSTLGRIILSRWRTNSITWVPYRVTAKSPLVALLASLRSMRSHTARCFARGGLSPATQNRACRTPTHPGVGSSITPTS